MYWVCPLVSESELIDLAAAEDRANALRTIYGDKVGLVHGQMGGGQRRGNGAFCKRRDFHFGGYNGD